MYLLNLIFILLLQNTYVPWRHILMSPAVWAIIMAHFCNSFGYYTLMTKLPAFMKEVLKFDITSVSDSSAVSKYVLSPRVIL